MGGLDRLSGHSSPLPLAWQGAASCFRCSAQLPALSSIFCVCCEQGWKCSCIWGNLPQTLVLVPSVGSRASQQQSLCVLCP